MAPMTRSSAGSLAPRSDGLQPPAPVQRYREVSWQFVGQSERRAGRDPSEEPASSFGEDADMMSASGNEEDDSRNRQVTGPEDHEDILHPLREAANRVGREVEEFAKVLDGYNPKSAKTEQDGYDVAITLVENFHGIARKTVKRLRADHQPESRTSRSKTPEERKREEGRRWREKMRGGFKITQDESEFYDDDEQDEGAESYPDEDFQTTSEDLKRWEQEAQTWDLLKRLVELRHQPGTSTKEESRTRARPLTKYSSSSEIWDKFLAEDELALERKTILQWLKDTAQESGKEIDVLVKNLQQNADRGDDIAHGCIHTKESIKQFKRLRTTTSKALDPASAEVHGSLLTSSKAEPLVSQLDPDATTRQNRKLQSQDEYFERAGWLGCYEMLRRGSSRAEVREWCSKRSEIWRAVTLSGLVDETDEETEAANPTSWALWRRTSFALARNGGGNEYERAVYGILSGDLSSVEPVCTSWDDFVFIHYNALLRSQFDNYLQKTQLYTSLPASILSLGIFDAVQSAGEPKNAGKRLIESLKEDSRTSAEASHHMKLIQGVLISDEFKDFIYHQGLALAKFANASGPSNVIPVEEDPPGHLDTYQAVKDHDSLRVFVHVLLVFMSLGVDLGGIWRQTAVENIIVSYVSFLRLSGKEELIPLYCSQLSGPRRYAILSRNLIDITDHTARVTQIQLMRQQGLNVQEFVKMQARYLLHDYPDEVADYTATGKFRIVEEAPVGNGTGRKIKPDFITEIMPPVSRVDTLLIRSFEWYLLIDGLWSETFKIGTMLYLRFFKHMHLASAQLLWTRVPSSSIAQRKTHAIIGSVFDFVDLEGADDEEEDLTEVVDEESYEKKRLLKQHLLNEARAFRDLEALAMSLEFLETVCSIEYLIAEENPENMNQSQARRELSRHFKGPFRQAMNSLLNRWLLTSQSDEREEEFRLLREAYLPEMMIAYIIALQFAGGALTRDYAMECMDLAAVIADEESDLLPLFEKSGRMQELVEAFAFASKNLLIITSEKKGSVSRSKNTRITGWKHDLWNVKP